MGFAFIERSPENLDLDADLWDYVIVHELLHFYVPNHGRLWKSLMRARLGEYEKAGQRLREIATPASVQAKTR